MALSSATSSSILGSSGTPTVLRVCANSVQWSTCNLAYVTSLDFQLLEPTVLAVLYLAAEPEIFLSMLMLCKAAAVAEC